MNADVPVLYHLLCYRLHYAGAVISPRLRTPSITLKGRPGFFKNLGLPFFLGFFAPFLKGGYNKNVACPQFNPSKNKINRYALMPFKERWVVWLIAFTLCLLGSTALATAAEEEPLVIKISNPPAMSMEKGSSYWFPSHDLKVYADGRVLYEGGKGKGTKISGEYQAKITPQQVDELVLTYKKISKALEKRRLYYKQKNGDDYALYLTDSPPEFWYLPAQANDSVIFPYALGHYFYRQLNGMAPCAQWRGPYNNKHCPLAPLLHAEMGDKYPTIDDWLDSYEPTIAPPVLVIESPKSSGGFWFEIYADGRAHYHGDMDAEVSGEYQAKITARQVEKLVVTYKKVAQLLEKMSVYHIIKDGDDRDLRSNNPQMSFRLQHQDEVSEIAPGGFDAYIIRQLSEMAPCKKWVNIIRKNKQKRKHADCPLDTLRTLRLTESLDDKLRSYDEKLKTLYK